MDSKLKFDLINLFRLIWGYRKLIIIVSLSSAIIGVIYSLFIPNRFSVTIKMLPLTEQSQNKGISNFASIAGIDLENGGMGNHLTPALYPTIVNSTLFLDSLARHKLRFEKSKENLTYYEYIKKQHKGDLTDFFMNFFSKLNFMSSSNSEDIFEFHTELKPLTLEEKKTLSFLNAKIKIIVDEKLGLITLNTTIQDRLAALDLSHKAQDLLESTVIKYRLQRAKENLDFSKKLYDDRKSVLDSVELKLNLFRDQNLGISTSQARAKLQNLETQYSIAANVFSQVAKQVEQDKIEVSKNTPSFAIIEPGRLPIEKSNMRKWQVVLIFAFVGLFVVIILIIVRKIINEILNDYSLKKNEL